MQFCVSFIVSLTSSVLQNKQFSSYREWESERDSEVMCVRRWTRNKKPEKSFFVAWKVNLGEVNSSQFADFQFNRKFHKISSLPRLELRRIKFGLRSAIATKSLI